MIQALSATVLLGAIVGLGALAPPGARFGIAGWPEWLRPCTATSSPADLMGRIFEPVPLAACRDSLSQRADLTRYTTTHAAADFISVLRTLFGTTDLAYAMRGLLYGDGQHDPVTPSRLADEVLRTMPNARSLVWQHGGHASDGLVSDSCKTQIIRDFIASADARTVAVDCMTRVAPVPFQIGR